MLQQTASRCFFFALLSVIIILPLFTLCDTLSSKGNTAGHVPYAWRAGCGDFVVGLRSGCSEFPLRYRPPLLDYIDESPSTPPLRFDKSLLPSITACKSCSTSSIKAALNRACGGDMVCFQNDLLRQHDYYDCPKFVEIIKDLPGYEDYITELHNTACQSLIKGSWYSLTGFKKTVCKLYRDVCSLQRARVNGRRKEAEKRNQSKRVSSGLTSERQASSLLLAEQKDLLEELSTEFKKGLDGDRAALMQQRLQAFHCDEDGICYEKQYVVSSQLESMFLDEGLNPQNYYSFWGNSLQQQLHEEVISIACDALDFMMMDHAHQAQHISKMVLAMNEAARESNNQGAVVQGFRLVDWCYVALSYGSAVVEGITKGIENIADSVLHCRREIYNLCSSLRDLFCGLIYLDFYGNDPALACEYILNPAQVVASQCVESCVRECTENPREVVKTIAQLVTEFKLPGVCCKMLGKFKNIAAIEKGVTGIKNLPRKELVLIEEVLTAPIQSVVVELEGAGALAAELAHNPLKDCFYFFQEEDIYKKALGAIQSGIGGLVGPLGKILFAEELNAIYQAYKSAVEKEIEALTLKFKDLFQINIDGFYSGPLEGDWMHGFDFSLRLNKKEAKEFITGLHHDHNRFLERAGIIELIDKTSGPGGTYKAHVKVGDIITREVKTFFPSHWSREKVMQEVVLSLEQGVKVFPQKDGRLRLSALCNGEFPIRVVWDKEKGLISFFPESWS